MEDEFLNDDIQRPSPRNFSEAWTKYILQFQMPKVEDEEQTKKDIINMLEPLINTAPRSNLDKRAIFELLVAYDDNWKAYFIYKRKGNYDPDLLILARILREAYYLMLRRALEMRQMAMIFEPKQTWYQHIISGARRKIGFFKSRKEKEEGEEGEY